MHSPTNSNSARISVARPLLASFDCHGALIGLSEAEIYEHKLQTPGALTRNHWSRDGGIRPDRASDFRKVLPHEA